MSHVNNTWLAVQARRIHSTRGSPVGRWLLMCKPSCCPGDNGSGFGAAIAASSASVVIFAMARPIIHAAEILLQVILITLASWRAWRS